MALSLPHGLKRTPQHVAGYLPPTKNFTLYSPAYPDASNGESTRCFGSMAMVAMNLSHVLILSTTAADRVSPRYTGQDAF